MQTEKASTKSSKELSCRSSETQGHQQVRIGLVESDPLRVIGCEAIFQSASKIELVATSVSALLLDRSFGIGIVGNHGDQDRQADVTLLYRVRPALHLIVLGGHGVDPRCRKRLAEQPHPRIFCLDEDCDPKQLRRTVETVLSKTLPREMKRVVEPRERKGAPFFQITRRERQVLDHLALAESNREIAEKLGIEERTVKGHVARLMRKTGVDNRTSLSFYALREEREEREL